MKQKNKKTKKKSENRMRVRPSARVREGNYQSFWTEEIRALCDGGRSLDITVAKRNPTKKTEPIVTKKT